MTRVSIVIPVYNEAKTALRCLASVFRSVSETSEVIVVDDASDGSQRSILLTGLSARMKRLNLITHARNVGFKLAVQAGISAARSEIVVILNSDTVVTPCFDTRLAACFQADSSLAAVAPVSNNPIDLYQYRELPIFDTDLGEDELAERAIEIDERLRTPFPVLSAVPYLTGACLALNRQVFFRAGGFGAEYEHGCFEDLALSWKFRTMRYTLAVCESCFVYHEGHISYRNRPQADRQEIIRRNFERFSRCCSSDSHFDELLKRILDNNRLRPV